jgi:hypothetical protein
VATVPLTDEAVRLVLLLLGAVTSSPAP